MTKRKDTRRGDRHRPGYWAIYMRAYRLKHKPAKPEPPKSLIP